ncbi:hypothetical protein [Roseovarius sp. D22-M7]|uniref:hypothetical protein n=1 Tax=Roseovarius sp. D22-M7 TaxID=3127116 RepID=UPI00300FA42D
MITFNAEYRVNMVCAGNTFQAMGPFIDPAADLTSTSQQNVSEYFAELGATDDTTCGIKQDGSIWCWGADNEGKLGNGGPTSGSTDPSISTPTQITFSGTFSDLQMSRNSCALRDDGKIFCWARFRWHWTSSPTNQSHGQTWKDINAGGYSSLCAIRSDDRLFCWGSHSSTPLEIVGGGTWKQVEGGCAIKMDDSIWCGFGSGGTPVLKSGGNNWKELFDGPCAIKDDDTLWCWGSDGWGQLGNGGGGDAAEPEEISIGGTWKTIDRSRHACAIRLDGSLWCWGANNTGQLGDGTTSSRQSPVNIQPGTKWLEVAVTTNNKSAGHTCATRLDGARFCWGANDNGQLGNLSSPANITNMTAIDDTGNYTAIYSSDSAACALRVDGTLWCWGSDASGVLGNGAGGGGTALSEVDGGGTWKSVGMSTTGPNAEHACAIKSDDTLWCWGANDHGQVGVGVTGGDYQSPVQVSPGTTWKMVAAGHWQNGDGHTCAIRSDDTLWCWGINSEGQLGIGSTVDQNAPVQVSVGTTWKYVDLGSSRSSCAIRSDDRLYCWGVNKDGKFGNGTYSSSNVPVVSGTATWSSIESGSRTSCGIQLDGSYWCAGVYNGNTFKPYQTGQTFIRQGAQGDERSHICAMRSDDTWWCGVSTASFSQLDGGPWVDVATLGGNTCGIRVGGQIYCKGAANAVLGFSWNTTETALTLGDCGAPITQSGGIRYHAATNSMTYCDGVGFRTIGK